MDTSLWKTYRVAICLVIGMGFLFLLGLAALILGIVFAKPHHAQHHKGPTELPIPVDPEARLHTFSLSRGTLFLHMREPDEGREEILVIDPRKGKLLRRIRLLPSP